MQQLFNSSSLKSFFIKLACFFTLVFLVDFSIGSILKKYYFKQKAGLDYETTYAMDKTEADILILGSSRASNLFDPEIFEQHFNMSCYNAGRYGLPLFYHYAVFKAALKRHTPKIVLLSFDAGNFSKNQDSYDRITALLPYYSDHPEIRSVVNLKGPYERLKLLSHIYPYNSLVLPIISSSSAQSKIKYMHNNGFIPLNKTFTGPLPTFDYSAETEMDTVKINIYKAFIEQCIKSGIQLYIACPPYMIHSIGTDQSIIIAKNIAKEYRINFFDYSRDNFFINKPELFADFRHLNKTGAELFCNMIVDQINQKYPQ